MRLSRLRLSRIVERLYIEYCYDGKHYPAPASAHGTVGAMVGEVKAPEGVEKIFVPRML
jgi:hypothetical protein